MTIGECLDRVDRICKNGVDPDIKLHALSELDQKIYHTVFLTHEGEFVEFSGYDENTGDDTKLLIPSPWDHLYVDYLIMRVAQIANEAGRYNNARTAFEEKMTEFRNWYTRTHVPKQGPSVRYWGGAR